MRPAAGGSSTRRSRPVRPAPTDGDPDASAWVTLVHPDLPDARHDFPNNPDALAGAALAGWVRAEQGRLRPGAGDGEAPRRRRRGGREEPPAVAAGSDSEQAESSATTVKE
jgi:hypothetical protein